jgi:nicotinate-nucleotide adenylyltransferase
MKVALFGGSFDPPHLGHQAIASNLLEKQLVDEVWFIPLKQHPFGKIVGPDQQRLAMLELMIAASPWKSSLKIKTYELEKDKPSYSLETLQYFRSQQPENTFSWVIGSDNLQGFHKWYLYRELVASFSVFVYPREGSPLEPLYDSMVALKDMPYVTISSTEVREVVQSGRSIAGLVDPAVETYIKDHHLYVTDSD